MKIKVYLTKETNFFFFLMNLSKGDNYFKEEYRKEWLKIIGPLSKKEKVQLKKFAKVLKEISKKKSLIGLFFDPEVRGNLTIIRNKISLKNYKIIGETINLFSLKFNKIWKKLGKDKNKVKVQFEKLIKNFPHFIKVIKELKQFYHKNSLPNKVNIYLILLPSSLKSGGGRFNRDKKVIVLYGNSKRMVSKKTLAIFFHELIHLWFEWPYFEKLLDKYLKNPAKKHLIKEQTANFLLPSGYLWKKYFS